MALPASENSNYLPFAPWGFLLIYTIGDKEILINDANFRKAPLQPPTNHPRTTLFVKRVTQITLPLPRENKISTLHIPNNMQKSAFRPNLHQASEIPRRKMATLLCINRNHSFNTHVQI